MIENGSILSLERTDNSVKKKKTLSKLVVTFFRNALRSNLDLLSLADTKAGILISINGFILTVSVTASSFAVHNTTMNYAFIAIIVTSLGSIILAVMAVKPRNKNKFVPKENLEGYSSLLYYQDMATLEPKEYIKSMNKALKSSKKSKIEIIKHLHILGAEIKKKYFWLKQAYAYFSLGLLTSASLMIYGLVHVEQTAFYNLSNGNIEYKKDKFDNIFEPSGATKLSNGNILLVEDEGGANSLKLIDVDKSGIVSELGKMHLPKKLRKYWNKNIEDLEAVTSHANQIFAITSHSLNRNGKRKSEREKLIMLTYNGVNVENYYIYNNLKDDLYKHFPTYFTHSVLQSDDINIEGLVYSEDENILYIAFRAPLQDGKTMLIGIKNIQEQLLENKSPKFTKPILLNLNGLGIRDITYDTQKKGYWIVAGSSTNRNNAFELWFWNKKKNKLLFVKNHPNIGFGEGIVVVNDEVKDAGLLIVEDDGQKPNKSADYIIINRDSL